MRLHQRLLLASLWSSQSTKASLYPPIAAGAVVLAILLDVNDHSISHNPSNPQSKLINTSSPRLYSQRCPHHSLWYNDLLHW